MKQFSVSKFAAEAHSLGGGGLIWGKMDFGILPTDI